MSSEITNIKERLAKVSILVEEKYLGAVSQLIKDCRFLITVIETMKEYNKHDDVA